MLNSFFENNFCPIDEAHRIGNDLNGKNVLSFLEIELYLSSVGFFQFSKFHENEFKYNQLNFDRGLTVKVKVKYS